MVAVSGVWFLTTNTVIGTKGAVQHKARYPRYNVNFATDVEYAYMATSDTIRVEYESTDLNHLVAHLWTPRIVNRNPIDYATQYPAVRVEVQCLEPPDYTPKWLMIVGRACSPLGTYNGIGGWHNCPYGPLLAARAVYHYGTTITRVIPIPLARPIAEVDFPPDDGTPDGSESEEEQQLRYPWIIHPKRRMNAALNQTILNRGFSRISYNDDFRPWRRVAEFIIQRPMPLINQTYKTWKNKNVTYGWLKNTNTTYGRLKGIA